jgi:hypothetical protein
MLAAPGALQRGVHGDVPLIHGDAEAAQHGQVKRFERSFSS